MLVSLISSSLPPATRSNGPRCGRPFLAGVRRRTELSNTARGLPATTYLSYRSWRVGGGAHAGDRPAELRERRRDGAAVQAKQREAGPVAEQMGGRRAAGRPPGTGAREMAAAASPSLSRRSATAPPTPCPMTIGRG